MNDLDDDYIVCDCARTNLKTIKDAIKNFDLLTIEDIGNVTISKISIFPPSITSIGLTSSSKTSSINSIFCSLS